MSVWRRTEETRGAEEAHREAEAERKRLRATQEAEAEALDETKPDA